jgi:AcrR family transcriptional regulator
MLAASHAAVAVIIERGSDDVTVKELADAAGISERTFYRFFPHKEDCLRPILADAREVFQVTLAAEASAGWRHAVTSAFRAAASDEFRERTQRLMPIVRTSPALEAVWNHEMLLHPADSYPILTAHAGEAGNLALIYSVTALMTLALMQASTAGEDAADLFELNLNHLASAFREDTPPPSP